MPDRRTEGVVLEALPYQDHHHIISLFTPEEGLVKLFAKGYLRARRASHGIVTPLTRIEALYGGKEGQTLWRLKEASVLDPHLALRTDLSFLQNACYLAHVLLKSQLPGKPAPALYQLFLAYLRHIPKSDHSHGLRASFALKVLLHEGLLGLSTHCSACQAPLTQIAFLPGEVVCPLHAPSWALTFTEEEVAQLTHLVTSRSLSAICEPTTPKSMQLKSHKLFEYLSEQDR